VSIKEVSKEDKVENKEDKQGAKVDIQEEK